MAIRCFFGYTSGAAGCNVVKSQMHMRNSINLCRTVDICQTKSVTDWL